MKHLPHYNQYLGIARPAVSDGLSQQASSLGGEENYYRLYETIFASP